MCLKQENKKSNILKRYGYSRAWHYAKICILWSDCKNNNLCLMIMVGEQKILFN